MYEISQKSCVKVVSNSGNSKGTGFFISENLVATCFHVIASIQQNGVNVQWDIFQDLKVTTINGEELDADCISVPTQTELSPLVNDFAILELSQQPTNLDDYDLKLTASTLDDLNVGAGCYYSGYPLASPTMITNKGYISGIAHDVDIICVDGSINKGNSGGALISEEGEVLGIISMREGGISKGLQELTLHIEATSKQGTVQIMGVDALQAIKETIETLNKYISTGLGYARDIKYLKEYCETHNINIP